MNKTFTIICLLILGSLFTSCKKDNDKPSQYKLISNMTSKLYGDTEIKYFFMNDRAHIKQIIYTNEPNGDNKIYNYKYTPDSKIKAIEIMNLQEDMLESYHYQYGNGFIKEKYRVYSKVPNDDYSEKEIIYTTENNKITIAKHGDDNSRLKALFTWENNDVKRIQIESTIHDNLPYVFLNRNISIFYREGRNPLYDLGLSQTGINYTFGESLGCFNFGKNIITKMIKTFGVDENIDYMYEFTYYLDEEGYPLEITELLHSDTMCRMNTIELTYKYYTH